MAKEFFTPEEVAAKLKLSKYTIYEMIKRGDLEAHRIGRGLRISSEQLEGYLHQHKTDEDNVFDAQLVQSEQGTYARLLHCEPEVLFHVSTPLTGAVRVSIEPENIIISHTQLVCSARNVHKGMVTAIQEENGHCMLTLYIGVPLKVALTSYSVQEMDLKPGDMLYAIFKSMSVKVTAR